MRAIHWFRNDLRLRDNRALARAATAAELAPVFVLDPRLWAAGSPRTRFLLGCLERLGRDLSAAGQRLVIRRGDPVQVIPALLRESGARLLTLGRDGSPFATTRDEAVQREAERLGVRVVTCKDRVVFEAGEILTGAGKPFRVYGPYRRAWLRRLSEDPQDPRRAPRLPPPIRGLATVRLPSDTGASELPTPGSRAARRRLGRFLEHGLREYSRRRELPAEDGTSRLSPHLRFGTISARDCVQSAFERSLEDPRLRDGAERWIGELVWREFYQDVLATNPYALRGPLRTEFQGLEWDDDPEAFEAWRDGRTGYPFVDAGMRQLAATGWMHNRVRMVVASFLTKDLGIDWRRGEALFMEHLVDGDPASNNGGWQWCASTGTDAQPWFRIFNPVSQGERFDPQGAYVRRFVPELRGLPDRYVQRPWEAPSPPRDYPPRIVDHAERREIALERWRRAAGAAP